MRSAGLLCVCALLAPLGAASEFAGTWKREELRSYPLASAAVEEKKAEVIKKIRDVQNGIAYRSSTGLAYTARFDGKTYPAQSGSEGVTVTLRRLDSHAIRVVVKRKDGAVVRTTTLSVANGELTEASEIATSAGGILRSVAVYRRQ